MSGQAVYQGVPPGNYSGVVVGVDTSSNIPFMWVANSSVSLPGLMIGAIQIDPTSGTPTNGNQTSTQIAPPNFGTLSLLYMWLCFDSPWQLGSLFYLCYVNLTNTKTGFGGQWVPPCGDSSQQGNEACGVYLNNQALYVPYVATLQELTMFNISTFDLLEFNSSVISAPFDSTDFNYGHMSVSGTASGTGVFAGPQLYAWTVSLPNFAAESALMEPQWFFNAGGVTFYPANAHPAVQFNVYMSNGSNQFVYVGSTLCNSGLCNSAPCCNSAQCYSQNGMTSQNTITFTTSPFVSGARTLLAPASWPLSPSTGLLWDNKTQSTARMVTTAGFPVYPAIQQALTVPATSQAFQQGNLLPALPLNYPYQNLYNADSPSPSTDGVCMVDLTVSNLSTGGPVQLVFSPRWPFCGTGGGYPTCIIQALYYVNGSATYWVVSWFDDTCLNTSTPRASVTIPVIPITEGTPRHVGLYVSQPPTATGANTFYVLFFDQEGGNGNIATTNTQFNNTTNVSWLTIPAFTQPSPPSFALCPASLFGTNALINAPYTLSNYTTMSAEQAACQSKWGGFRGFQASMTTVNGQAIGLSDAAINSGSFCFDFESMLCNPQYLTNGFTNADSQSCCVFNSATYKALLPAVPMETAAQIAGCFDEQCGQQANQGISPFRPGSDNCTASQCLTVLNVVGNYNTLDNNAQTTICNRCTTSGSGCSSGPSNTTEYLFIGMGVLVLVLLGVLVYRQNRAQR
jgi:hypothetical protein